jgi:hypothetical protein
MTPLAGWEGILDRHAGGLVRFGVALPHVRWWGGLVYVATPYSKRVTDADGLWDGAKSRALAYEAAAVCDRLMMHGAVAISPIAQAHLMVSREPRPEAAVHPLDHDAWADWCARIVAACGAVFIPDLPGWAESEGVLQETAEAVRLCKPVLIEAEGWGWTR